MSERPYRNKDWLLEKYYTEDMTTTEIANLPESCSRKTLNTWFNRNGIQRIQTPHLPYEALAEKYRGGKSIHDLASEYDVDAGTISCRLKEVGVTPDNSGPRKRHISMTQHGNGCGVLYEAWKHENTQCYVHQLLAISKGAEPTQIFSNRDYHVHHKNEIPWDNRPENIEVLTASEHAKHHN